jgi:K(+)-stimulated pyrophosphate-energized sodium pump
MWICSAGIFSSLIGMACVRCTKNAGQNGVLLALRIGLIISNVIQIGCIVGITALLSIPWLLFGCICIGLVTGVLIALNSEFFTSAKYSPTRSIAASAQTGQFIIFFIPILLYRCCISNYSRSFSFKD